MNERNGIEFADILGIMSFMLGMENLYENRAQSAQNDVGAANDKQASFLLSEIGKRLDEQDRTLDRILRKLEQMEGGKEDDTV